MLRSGQWKLFKNRVTRKQVHTNSNYINASKYRIVEAFNDIVDALIEQVNFTNISVSTRDLALRGERVSYYCNNDSESLLHVFLID